MKTRVTLAGRELEVEEVASARGEPAFRIGEETFVVTARRLSSPADPAAWEIIVESEGRRILLTADAATATEDGFVRLIAGGRVVDARVETERDRLRAVARPRASVQGRKTARSALPGIIRRVLLKSGDRVDEGTPILTLEAMKMENEIRAELKGRLVAILVKEGQVVNAGEALAEIEPVEDGSSAPPPTAPTAPPQPAARARGKGRARKRKSG